MEEGAGSESIKVDEINEKINQIIRRMKLILLVFLALPSLFEIANRIADIYVN